MATTSTIVAIQAGLVATTPINLISRGEAVMTWAQKLMYMDFQRLDIQYQELVSKVKWNLATSSPINRDHECKRMIWLESFDGAGPLVRGGLAYRKVRGS
ncbi:hypothetical protein F53441_1694 [Fusarium austroafricanum]|uniref:Uncharacterized protein n=1 Tax=Fusarium austroafricanum TaxID=2364996 RepID=A0A8H4KUS5_9HYPO|nr:hypothetical protein F53441_1694 [Fusarium austroafricanum]